jgi:hypothetical protein
MSIATHAVVETFRPPRPRRWIPVSLRIFVAILVLFGIGSVLALAEPASRQQAAFDEIERLGGRIDNRPRGLEWLHNMTAEQRQKFFDRVHSVELYNTRADDATLAHLKSFPALRWLTMSSTRVTDEGLAHLKDLPRLQNLYLGFTKVSDAGLAHLRGLKSLEGLHLYDTLVTDTGLAHLRGLTNLQSLELGGTRVRAGLVAPQ